MTDRQIYAVFFITVGVIILAGLTFDPKIGELNAARTSKTETSGVSAPKIILQP